MRASTRAPRLSLATALLALLYVLSLASCVVTGTPTKHEPGPKTGEQPGKKEPGQKQAKTDPSEQPPGPNSLNPVDPLRPPGDHPEPSLVEEYPVERVRYVGPRGGLNLRSAPDGATAVVRVLRYREQVRVTARRLGEIELGSKRGHWVRVEAGGSRGWVFDAYLLETAPPEETELSVGELFARTAFRSRLISGESGRETVLGGLKKGAGRKRFEVATLKRLCGSGIADEEPASVAETVDFYVSYRWCRVDPGDIVRTRCIKCDLVRYRCSVSRDELSRVVAAAAFEEPVRCAEDERSYCEKDCDSPLPLRPAGS